MLRLEGVGFRVSFGAWRLECPSWDLGFGDLGFLGCRLGVSDLGFKVWGLQNFCRLGFGFVGFQV